MSKSKPPDSSGAAYQLGRSRAFFFSALTLISLLEFLFHPGVIADWAALPSELWLVVGPQWLSSKPPLSAQMVLGLHLVWLLLLASSAAGLYTRLSTVAAATLGVLLVAQAQVLGANLSGYTLILPFLIVFALAPCGHAYSLDSRRGKPPDSEWRYASSQRVLQIMVVLLALAAGLTKLATGGFSWVTSDLFADHLLRFYHQHPHGWWAQLIPAQELSGHPRFCKFLALVWLGCELCMPLLLFDRIFRPALLVGAFFVVLFYWGADPGTLKLLALLGLFSVQRPGAEPESPTPSWVMPAAVAVASLFILLAGSRVYPVERSPEEIAEAHLWVSVEFELFFSFRRRFQMQVRQTLPPLDSRSLLRLCKRSQAPQELLGAIEVRCLESFDERLKLMQKRVPGIRVVGLELRQADWEYREWIAFHQSAEDSYFKTPWRPTKERVLAQLSPRKPAP